MTDPDDSKALSLENESVHRVYEIIASHFSDTRYKVVSQASLQTYD
jgi:hypothetical protein